MNRLREGVLNGFLAVLVIMSIGLSAQIWFPAEPSGGDRTKAPSIQVAPAPQQGMMPKVFRPERIYVRQKTGAIAMLSAGSTPYKQMWYGVQGLLEGMAAVGPSTQLDEPVDPEAEVVTLVMPLSLTVEQWASIWNWNTAGLRNFSMKVDRMTLYLDPKNPMLHLSGSSTSAYRLAALSPQDTKLVREAIAGLDRSLFAKYRPLETKETGIRVTPGLLVPEVSEVPLGSLEVRKPDQKVEEARFFPDLTVVRQIDEKDARSFTDGQRLLRVTAAGELEYFSVNAGGSPIAPDLQRARSIASEWVDAHGGWPQEVVMGWYAHQPGKTSLVFDLRMDGVYPVESAGGALRLQVATHRDAAGLQHNSVTQFQRFPEFTPYFGRARKAVISPEKAVQLVASKFSALLLFEEVREVHLAYLIRLAGKTEADWVLDPAWVVQVGEERIYAPATVDLNWEPFVARP